MIKVINDNMAKSIKALQEGNIVLLLDAHDRENEGDLIVAAEKITAKSMTFLIKNGSGIVCLPMEKARLAKLGLYTIPDNNNSFNTAFTVSIEARDGVTTGVSAQDRSHTIKIAIDDNTQASDLARPGHVFPLAAQEGGVFKRMGHTEGSIDLMKIAGLKPAAVLCELMNEDGSMATGEQRNRFATKFSIPIVSIEEIVYHRMRHDNVYHLVSNDIDSKFGPLTHHNYVFLSGLNISLFTKVTKFTHDHRYHVAMIKAKNLHDEYCQELLRKHHDSPLPYLCEQLTANQLDVLIFISHDHLYHPSIINAAIARALLDLNIRQISPQFMHEIIPVLPYFGLNAQ